MDWKYRLVGMDRYERIIRCEWIYWMDRLEWYKWCYRHNWNDRVNRNNWLYWY
jgi:hypothetical protein